MSPKHFARRDIAFDAGGTRLAGWLYMPRLGAEPSPLIVMTHGLSGVIAMGLEDYAGAFAEAGLASLLYDHRNFGMSGGEPRQEADPWQQVHDMRDAIGFARTLPGIDGERIGLWGTSYSGGHAIVLGALDRRVKCVIAQAPLVSGHRTMAHWVPPAEMPALIEDFIADRDARARGAAPVVTPVVEPGTEEAAWVEATDKTGAFVNEITLRSRELILEYEPDVFIERIAPTPFMMIVATRDSITPSGDQMRVFERALEPKRLVTIDCGHFDVYSSHLAEACGAAREWFSEHLLVG